MKVISIKEPFASLVAGGIKRIETRSWRTHYRGVIYIHASLSKVNLKDDRIGTLISLLPNKDFKYGHIIAKANLVDCVFMSEDFLEEMNKESNKIEKLCGGYSEGRYAWVLDQIEIITPIPVKGRLGIWNYEGTMNI